MSNLKLNNRNFHSGEVNDIIIGQNNGDFTICLSHRFKIYCYELDEELFSCRILEEDEGTVHINKTIIFDFLTFFVKNKYNCFGNRFNLSKKDRIEYKFFIEYDYQSYSFMSSDFSECLNVFNHQTGEVHNYPSEHYEKVAKLLTPDNQFLYLFPNIGNHCSNRSLSSIHFEKVYVYSSNVSSVKILESDDKTYVIVESYDNIVASSEINFIEYEIFMHFLEN